MDAPEDIKAAFEVVAKGSGSISTAELTFVMTSLGDALTEDEAKSMVKVVDANGDGNVDYTEFNVMLEKCKGL